MNLSHSFRSAMLFTARYRRSPAILLHGNRDRQMPVNQLLELEAAYRKAGLSVETMIVDGAEHGDKVFNSGEAAERVLTFLRRTIGRQ